MGRWHYHCTRNIIINLFLFSTKSVLFCFCLVSKEKIRTRLDLLSIPQSGGRKCQNFQVGSKACMAINVSVQHNGGVLRGIIR